ncbi:ABC transporter substrate-binding protein [Propionibacteriaceae bacterium Y2011]|uniref:ABC transporter substrate-binding protein n=1 Tax=Microlunatus sp. Y2014 TaxID=3418488 RepID=UPI003B455B72
MFLRRNSKLAGALVTAVAALTMTACSGGTVPEGPPGQEGSESAEAVNFDERGPISFVTGKDTSGNLQNEIDMWNSEHPGEEVKLIELSDEADQQRQSMVQNAQTGGTEYTVLNVDVVWTAEFAANGWIVELPADKVDTSAMLPATVESATYFERLYAMPVTSDGGLLYYRTDWMQTAGIDAPPKTFAEVKEACATIKEKVPEAKDADCYGGQFNKYEGLTVNVSEFVNSAGGTFVTEDGTPAANSPEAVKGLTAMKELFDDGTIPKAAMTWTEEESRQAFQDGKLMFLRNWPYVYALAEASDGSSKVNGKFGVATLPGVDGPGVSSLGGHNYAISSFAKNKGTALEFMTWMASEERMIERTKATSNAPTRESLYTNAELTKEYPYLPVLLESIQGAQPRPKAVQYGDVTLAIQDATYTTLQGTQEPQAAFDGLQAKLEELLKK